MSIFSFERDAKQEELLRCAEYRNGAIEAHISAYEVAFKDFWENPIVTPQEQCDAFGNQAVQFFIVSNTTQEYIKAMKPEWIPPVMPYEFTMNQDGTVTIGEKIPEEEITE